VQGDTGEVRAGEALDWEALAAYVRWHFADDQIPGLRLSAPMEVLQFHGGHSNLTYVVRFGGADLVVRRPPVGPVPPRAHDMAREYRWLAALHPLFPLAPRPYILCEDETVLGTVFYVMERRRGMVVRRDEPLPLAGHPDVRRRVSEAMVETLAGLHAVDVTREPFADLGRPSGFVERQVRGWTDRWKRSQLDALPEMDDVAAWLASHLPPDPDEPSIVHGDFKLDNVLLDPLEPGRVTAVLDWEMCAAGEPLVDLGIMLAYWTAPAAGGAEPDALTTVTGRPGYFTRDELIDAYAWRSGRNLTGLRFYEALALFKIAVVIQQIAFRFRQGQTSDRRFATFGDRVIHLARHAAALLA
jgi:aminoglycoside phosphotransferase (APT) family kinase protein